MPSHRRLLLGTTLAAIASTGLGLFWLSGATPKATANAPAHEEIAVRAASPRDLGASVTRAASTTKAPTAPTPDASYATALSMFREYSKYPPNSRPLSEGAIDVAEPLTVAEPFTELVQESSAGGAKLHSGVFCLFQPARQTVRPGQTQLVTLSCQRGSPTDIPKGNLPIVIEGVSATCLSGTLRSDLALKDAVFRDDGNGGDQTAGDHTYAASPVVPAGCRGLAELQAKVRVVAREANDALEAQTLVARFMITPPAPAHFTGKLVDELRDGSLVVRVEVEVEQTGRYRVYANLEHDGQPLAYAKEDLELNPGRQEVSLLFFGKILRDAAIAGPYLVSNLRGQRLNLEPGNGGVLAEPIEPIVRAHETAAYDSEVFSQAEWDSPYKQERLAELTALAGR